MSYSKLRIFCVIVLMLITCSCGKESNDVTSEETVKVTPLPKIERSQLGNLQFNGNETLKKMESISKLFGVEFKYDFNDVEKTFGGIEGILSIEKISTIKEAQQYLDNINDVLKIVNSKVDVVGLKDEIDGAKHFNAILKAGGIDVYGSEIIIHTDIYNIVKSITGILKTDLPNKNWNNLIKLKSEDVDKIVLNKISEEHKGSKVDNLNKKLYIYDNNGTWIVAYIVDCMVYVDDDILKYNLIINAENNEVIECTNSTNSVNKISKGTTLEGKKVELNSQYLEKKYYLIDDITLKNEIVMVSAVSKGLYYKNPKTDYKYVSNSTNVFNEKDFKPSVTAQDTLTKVLKYYKEKFKRDSYDNKSGGFDVVNYLGSKFDNAYWSYDNERKQGVIRIGDGNGKDTQNYSIAEDVLGHEFTHGVIQFTCDLKYSRESGALNESMADVFGYFFQYYLTKQEDWDFGEKIYTSKSKNKAFRNFKNPEKYNQPSQYSKKYKGTQDNCGVHVNSGILNKAFYNIISQGNSDKIEKIYYRAMCYYFTKTTDFKAAKKSLLLASKDLYPKDKKISKIIDKGFSDVGIK